MVRLGWITGGHGLNVVYSTLDSLLYDKEDLNQFNNNLFFKINLSLTYIKTIPAIPVEKKTLQVALAQLLHY